MNFKFTDKKQVISNWFFNGGYETYHNQNRIPMNYDPHQLMKEYYYNQDESALEQLVSDFLDAHQGVDPITKQSDFQWSYQEVYQLLRKNLNNFFHYNHDSDMQESVQRCGKNVIRLTEGDLHNIIKESVQRVLKEGKLGDAYTNLQNASELVRDIMDSSFIPFTSPSPSSTEVELKKTIIEAARMLDKAMYLCGQLGYNQPTAHVV